MVQCEICGRQFGHPMQLGLHMDREHYAPPSIDQGPEKDAMFAMSEPMDLAWRLLKGNFFDNMRAKKKRGEKAAKPGEEDYPSKDQWKDITAKGEKPDPRLKSAGVSGYNKPKRTPKHPKKSHVVVARSGGKTKTIRFGEQGASVAGKPKSGESAKMKAKRKSFKSRHAKNIKRGPMSAAYWADKVKW